MLFASWPAAAQREHPIPKELLERVAEWADAFSARMPGYAAEETLEQTVYSRGGRAGGQRRVVSDFFSVRLAESRSEFRDAVAVDGKVIQTAAQREAKWTKLLATTSTADFAALLESPNKFRLSPEYFEGLSRLVSRFATRHHDKMKYFFGADTSDPPSRNVLIAYRQIAGDGLMLLEDKPVNPSGQAWVDPDDGHIVRIEEEVKSKDTMYYLAVEFVKPEELGAWVPQQITVRVIEKGRMALENSYSYSNFRRLERPADSATTSLPK
ncbi:MAG TPA: hypothetical protein VNL38_03520 [Candidatus Nitrosotenuis sp.]|nr:hypothetical protein [Candidatus Nitrosotenuis sp.]